jgi:hypothetical protein
MLLVAPKKIDSRYNPETEQNQMMVVEVIISEI